MKREIERESYKKRLLKREREGVTERMRERECAQKL
jgi:hypothetical protein